MSLSESFLNDDINQGMRHIVVLHLQMVKVLPREVMLRVNIHNDLILYGLVLHLQVERFKQVSHSEQIPARSHIDPHHHFKLLLGHSENLMRQVGIVDDFRSDFQVVDEHIQVATQLHHELVGH